MRKNAITEIRRHQSVPHLDKGLNQRRKRITIRTGDNRRFTRPTDPAYYGTGDEYEIRTICGAHDTKVSLLFKPPRRKRTAAWNLESMMRTAKRISFLNLPTMRLTDQERDGCEPEKYLNSEKPRRNEIDELCRIHVPSDDEDESEDDRSGEEKENSGKIRTQGRTELVRYRVGIPRRLLRWNQKAQRVSPIAPKKLPTHAVAAKRKGYACGYPRMKKKQVRR